MVLTQDALEKRDARDPLSGFRKEFVLPAGISYLDGNSLGAMPKATAARIAHVVQEEWGNDLITSWNKNGWFSMATRVGDKIASLIGVGGGEVLAVDSTGINLYKVLAKALALRPQRKIILMEGSNFPTDNYVAQNLVRHLAAGHEVRFADRHDIADHITPEVAVVALTHVHYKTGAFFDIEGITARAHGAGALVCWDLCHSAGALPVNLGAANADFAVGCGYKYLNGGPGAPGFLFAAKRHHGQAVQPLGGWWSHADPFAFEQDYRPAMDIHQMMSGTQPILSLAALEVGVDLMLQADQQLVREKSMALGEVFKALMEANCAGYGFELASPALATERASQIAFTHPQGYAIMRALIAQKVIGDFRAPDIMRFGFTPLYTSFDDVWRAVQTLKTIMEQSLWRDPSFAKREAVT